MSTPAMKITNFKGVNNDAKLKAAFEIFVKWLYDGEIFGPSWCNAEPYVYAWSLAEKFGCPIFKDLAMIQLIEMHHHILVTPDTVQAVYKTSPVSSKLREWAVKQFMLDVKLSNNDHDRDAWMSLAKSSPDFAPEFVGAFITAELACLSNPYEHGDAYLELLPYETRLQKQAGSWAQIPTDEVKKQELDTK